MIARSTSVGRTRLTCATALLLSLIFLKSCQHVTTQSDNTLNEPEVLPTTIEDIIKETKVGYIKLDSEIEINATPSDVVVVMLGGSGGPDGDNPLGGTGMMNPGVQTH